MQPRTWLVGALMVAMVGIVQPIILTGTLIAAGGAAALLGAATLGAGAVGVGVVGAGALAGAAKLGTVGAAKLGVAKVGAVGAGALGGVGAAKLGTVGLAKVGLGTVLSSGGSTRVTYSSHNQHSGEQHRSYSSNNQHGGQQQFGFTKRVTFSSHQNNGGQYGSNSRHRREIRGYTNAQEMLLRDAFALDQEKPCGLRLVCELATKGADELEVDELLIMDLLHQPHSISSMAVPYDEAAHLGRTSSSSTVCGEVYQRCNLNRYEIMHLLRQHNGA